ncbi:hypothetical protein RYX36_013506 [Vicia faba]
MDLGLMRDCGVGAGLLTVVKGDYAAVRGGWKEGRRGWNLGGTESGWNGGSGRFVEGDEKSSILPFDPGLSPGRHEQVLPRSPKILSLERLFLCLKYEYLCSKQNSNPV